MEAFKEPVAGARMRLGRVIFKEPVDVGTLSCIRSYKTHKT